jgi:hypothetical protein
MKYQDCAEALQADDAPEDRANAAVRLADANINPLTGLATDYLNHFNEAIMLLEMLSSCPECRDDFLVWRPMSYREHFESSLFKGRVLAIAAYDAAGAYRRAGCFQHGGHGAGQGVETAAQAWIAAVALAERAASLLRPLVARAGAVINGEDADDAGVPVTPQAVVDALMRN